MGQRVQLRLKVQRFFCDNMACPWRTFGERFPEIVAAHARRTNRLLAHQRQAAFALGGEAGARLLSQFSMATSADTLIRLVRKTPDETIEGVRVLGVDDWAKRKGQSYGTILVDLERHQPIDLLPDRSAESLAAWLKAHPGVEIITRDRATAYADGATQGAPAATQVADRWHLLKNMGDAVRRLLDRQAADLREVAKRLAEPAPVTPEIEAATIATKLETPAADVAAASAAENAGPDPKTYRHLRYAEVKALQQQGWSQRAIAEHLHMHRQTVRRYMNAERCPQRAYGQQSVSSVQPYLDYLRQRWAEGCHNCKQLWAELQQPFGYTGSYVSVWRMVSHFPETGAAPKPPKVPPFPVRQAVWLLVQHPDQLRPEEEKARQVLCEACPAAAQAYPLVQAFGQMIHERTAEAFDGWLTTALASGIAELRNFAIGLQQDYAAVMAALRLPWSNGQTEGQVNRLKFIKRAMDGRANFDLLRKRVLGCPAPS